MKNLNDDKVTCPEFGIRIPDSGIGLPFRISLVFVFLSLLVHFTQSFSYSQQSDKQNNSVASAEEYLKYEGPKVDPIPNMLSASLRMIVILLVLLALFFAVIFFIKKFQQRRSIQGKGPISVLFQLPVGSKEFICLVDVMGEILVLGVTSTQISLLFKIEDADALESLTELQTSLNDFRGADTTMLGHQFQNYLKSEQENVKMTTVLESLRSLRDKLRKV